jgi:hypothetical protein
MSIIWDGVIKISVPGTYAFSLTTVKESVLLIDDQEVVRNNGEGDHTVEARGSATLSPGQHRITIRYDRSFNYGTMELRWTPPGGTSEFIPLDVLRPATE